MQPSDFSVSFWTFIIIALGCLSCIIGGYVSIKKGSKTVAVLSLVVSGILCAVSPLLFHIPSQLFMALLCIWGMVVVSDSPQFSTMVAASVPTELKGTGLTLVNCIGFAISIVSIQLLSFLTDKIDPMYLFAVLGLGPLFGLINLAKKSP